MHELLRTFMQPLIVTFVVVGVLEIARALIVEFITINKEKEDKEIIEQHKNQ